MNFRLALSCRSWCNWATCAATDGHHTLEQMALAERAMGLSYLAITEHSRPLAMAHDLDPRRPAEQCDAIDRLNEKLDGIVLLKGIEVDMLRVIRHARQRGWLAAADVLNTRPLPELRRLLAGARK